VSYGDRAEEFEDKAEELTELTGVLRSRTDLASLQDCALRSEFILRPRLRRNLEELEIPD
jgi:hypothetical protein